MTTNILKEVNRKNVVPMMDWDSDTAYEYVQFCLRGLAIKNREDFEAWLQNDLKRLFPYGMLVCGLGSFQATGLIAKHLVSIDYPVENGNAVNQCGSLLSNSTIATWLRDREPQLSDAINPHSCSDDSVTAFRARHVGNMASHGVMDVDGRTGSYFFFYRIPNHPTQWYVDMLEMLIPHLHQAFVRAVRPSAQSMDVTKRVRQSLTQRELEILDLLIKGKSNWEISKISNRSLTTVKHEVSKILSKLGVTTRVQAAAKGVDLGLLDFTR